MPAPTKYFDIKERIRAQAKEMPIGAKIPTIQQLHEEFGVAQGTVIRAIQELVDEGLLEHRQNRGAFVAPPGHATRNFRIIWPNITDLVSRAPLSRHSLTGTLMHVLQRESSSRDRDLLITTGMKSSEINNKDAAGTLILLGYDADAIVAYRDAGNPVVVIAPMVDVPGVPSVRTDDARNFSTATRLLLDKHHQNILHLTIDAHLEFPEWPDAPESVRNFYPRERERGFRQAMEQAGIDASDLVWRAPNSDWTVKDEAGLVEFIRDEGITACTCFNDDLAVRLLHACQKSGLHVPEDIAIIGYDDLGVGLNTRPMLTSIGIPIDGLARAAVELLDDLVEQRAQSDRSIVVEASIVEREST